MEIEAGRRVWLGRAETLRRLWGQAMACPSEGVFSVGVSLVWLLLYNASFWSQSVASMWHPSAGSALFLVSLALLVTTLQAILLLLVPNRLLPPFAGLLFLIAALGSYFVNVYGVLLDREMLRNVFQTNPAEIGGLLNADLMLHVLVLGVLPAVAVWRVNLPASGWKTQLKQRIVFIIVSLAVSTLAMFGASANYAVFFREHKPIRYTLVPLMPMASAVGLATENWKHRPRTPPIDLSGNVRRLAAPGSRPLVLFVVVGETARAANFQLGGYERHTNPRLAGVAGLVYFDRVSSCGTSTAISVPCMFSHSGRARFDVDEARGYTNLLDPLVKAGFDVEWRDNNAGCKGVCERVAHVDYPPARLGKERCPKSYCYDEVMLTDLAEKLRGIEKDTAIVFHQIGSHGPAYSERYPPAFEPFKPACRSNQLQRCTREEIRNAYDNSIAYTDYILARQIQVLREADDRVDSLLIYVSDHGESLGEQGVYLHGMPYAFAPRAQKEVPMLIWMSHGFASRIHTSSGCLRTVAHHPFSHDNLYHTVLGAAQVRDALYDPRLDMLSACHPT